MCFWIIRLIILFADLFSPLNIAFGRLQRARIRSFGRQSDAGRDALKNARSYWVYGLRHSHGIDQFLWITDEAGWDSGVDIIYISWPLLEPACETIFQFTIVINLLLNDLAFVTANLIRNLRVKIFHRRLTILVLLFDLRASPIGSRQKEAWYSWEVLRLAFCSFGKVVGRRRLSGNGCSVIFGDF